MVSLSSFVGGAAGGATVNIIIRGVDKFSSTFKKAGIGMRALGVAASAAAIAVGVIGIAMIKLGKTTIKLASDLEQNQIAFETMLGSAQEATKFLTKLSDFAKKTPFEIAGIRLSARQLLAVGFEAKEVLPTLKAVGDVAAGIGRGQEGLQRLILNLGQVKTQAKLTGRELRDFAVLGVPLINVLSKTLGVTTAEIFKLTSAGKISSEVVVQAFMDMSSEGGRFANLSEKFATTVVGRFSNVKDELTLLGEDLGAFLTEPMKELAQTLFDDVIPQFEELVPLVGEKMAGAIRTLTPLLAEMTKGFTKLAQVLFADVGDSLDNTQEKTITLSKIIGLIPLTFAEVAAGLRLVFGNTLDVINLGMAQFIVTLSVLSDSTIKPIDKFRVMSERIRDINFQMGESVRERKEWLHSMFEVKDATESLTESLDEEVDVMKLLNDEFAKSALGITLFGDNAEILAEGPLRILIDGIKELDETTRRFGEGFAATRELFIGGEKVIRSFAGATADIRAGGATRKFKIVGGEIAKDPQGNPILNDFISRPGQPLQKFSSADTIIGTKDPASIGGLIGGDVNIQINATINNDTDVEVLANRIGDVVHQQLARR